MDRKNDVDGVEKKVNEIYPPLPEVKGCEKVISVSGEVKWRVKTSETK